MFNLSITTPLPFPYPNQPQSHTNTLTPIYINPQSQTRQNFPCFSTRKPRENSKISDVELASELAAEVNRLKTQLQERQNALKKSKEMLFSEICKFLDYVNPDEFKIRWAKMNPDEKLGLVDWFVSDWGLSFHPLSSKSVRNLVDEFVTEDAAKVTENSGLMKDGGSSSDSTVFLPSLKKLIMGFSPHN